MQALCDFWGMGLSGRVERLAKAKDFTVCYARGRVFKGRFIVVHALKKPNAECRVGFSVSKKLGKAVQRNRVKRRLREIIRSLGDSINPGNDLVIAARVAAAEAPYGALYAGVTDVLRRGGLLADGTERKIAKAPIVETIASKEEPIGKQ